MSTNTEIAARIADLDTRIAEAEKALHEMWKERRLLRLESTGLVPRSDAKERMRRALELSSFGWDDVRIGNALGVSRNTVRSLIRRATESAVIRERRS